MAAADWAGAIRVWDLRSVAAPRELAVPKHNLGLVLWSLDFSPDGHYFAAGGEGLAIWRVADASAADRARGNPPCALKAQPLARLEKCFPITVCFSPNSQLLGWMGPDHQARVWDWAASRSRAPLPPRSATSYAAMAFFPDGQRLALVNAAGEPEVWDGSTGQQLFGLGGQRAQANNLGTLALSRDGRWLATHAGRSSSAVVWDTVQRQRLFALPPESGIVWPLAWGRHDELLAIGTSDGALVIWDLPRVHAQLSRAGLDCGSPTPADHSSSSP
jgi:WD40 repeat protein